MTDVRDLKKGSGKDMTLEQLAEVVCSNDFYQDAEFRGIINGEDDININNRVYGVSPRWRTYASGVKYQILLEDKNKQIAEDFDVIPMTSCRCCKKENVEQYEEMFFEHHFRFKTLYCFRNGYCKACAELKAGIEHPKPALLKEDCVKESRYDVGGESILFKTSSFGEVWYWK